MHLDTNLNQWKVLMNQTQREDNFYMSACEHITDIKLILIAR